ncbi:MAG: hypothetical protein H7Y06_02100 [Opitutaceae bacterium]|nr:hypothetical protein [Opitutaceae bacterium]
MQPPPLPCSTRRPGRLWIYLLLAFTLATGGFIVWSLDEAPPDVSDLKFEPLALAETDNAYVLLTRAAEQAEQRLTLDPEDKTYLDEMSDGHAWDEDRVTKWLLALDPVWPLYEQAARTPLAQAPIAKSPEDIFPEIGRIRQLSQLSLLRARHSLRKNDPEAAVTQALITMEAGKRMTESRGSLITYLTGMAIKSFALPIIAEAARHPTCPANVIRDTVAHMESNRSPDESLAYALRAELYFCEGVLKIVETRGMSDLDGNYGSSAAMRLAPRIPLIYKGNKTRRIYAEFLREAIRQVGGNAASLRLYREQQNAYFKKRSYNPDNFVGRLILHIVTPTSASLVKSQLTEQSRISTHQALIAALAYQRERGKAPDSLDQLVPDYLSAVPQDYFTRAPIRYDATLGAIWFVGENNLTVSSPDQTAERRDIILWLQAKPTRESE